MQNHDGCYNGVAPLAETYLLNYSAFLNLEVGSVVIYLAVLARKLILNKLLDFFHFFGNMVVVVFLMIGLLSVWMGNLKFGVLGGFLDDLT